MSRADWERALATIHCDTSRGDVEILRTLAPRDPSRYIPDLATALVTLGQRHAALHNTDQELAVHAEAVAWWSRLATTNLTEHAARYRTERARPDPSLPCTRQRCRHGDARRARGRSANSRSSGPPADRRLARGSAKRGRVGRAANTCPTPATIGPPWRCHARRRREGTRPMSITPDYRPRSELLRRPARPDELVIGGPGSGRSRSRAAPGSGTRWSDGVSQAVPCSSTQQRAAASLPSTTPGSPPRCRLRAPGDDVRPRGPALHRHRADRQRREDPPSPAITTPATSTARTTPRPGPVPPTWTSRTGWRASCCSSTARWTTRSTRTTRCGWPTGSSPPTRTSSCSSCPGPSTRSSTAWPTSASAAGTSWCAS